MKAERGDPSVALGTVFDLATLVGVPLFYEDRDRLASEASRERERAVLLARRVRPSGSYLQRDDAIAIYDPELPLRPGVIEPPGGLEVPGCLLDAGPDSWGRRVILNRLLGPAAGDDTGELDDLTHLIHSGSNRIGGLGLPETAPREASYGQLAEIVRERFTDPRATLRELFARIVFNILSGNTDDHARNHAAFWDGAMLTLTPAYDICTYVRGGGAATQAMLIGAPGDPFRFSAVQGCVERSRVYGIEPDEAREIVEHQLETIEAHWDEVCDQARLATADKALFRRVFPHPYALEGFR